MRGLAPATEEPEQLPRHSRTLLECRSTIDTGQLTTDTLTALSSIRYWRPNLCPEQAEGAPAETATQAHLGGHDLHHRRAVDQYRWIRASSNGSQ